MSRKCHHGMLLSSLLLQLFALNYTQGAKTCTQTTQKMMEQNWWYSELLCKVGLLPHRSNTAQQEWEFKISSARDIRAEEVFNSHSCWAVLLRCQALLRKRAWKLTWQVPAARCLTPREQLRKCEISPGRCCNCNFGSIFCFLGSKS